MDMLFAVQVRQAQAGLQRPFDLRLELTGDVIEINTLPKDIATQGYRRPQKSSGEIHQGRNLFWREDGPASQDIEMDTNAQTFVRVR